MTELREYQEHAVDGLRQMVGVSGKRSPLLQMATGLGKTLCACRIIQSAVAKGRTALFLVNRRQLAFQTHEKLADFGVEAGIIMSGERPSLMPSVQVASVPTLYKRCFDEDGEPIRTEFQGKGMPLPKADVLVIDEAHATFGKMAQKIIAQYPDAIRIGMTATPARSWDRSPVRRPTQSRASR